MKNFKSIFILLVVCSICLVSCAKNEEVKSNENVSKVEQKVNNEEKNPVKEKESFSSEKTIAKFEYSKEFTISNTEEVKMKLSENNMQIEDNSLKEILKSSKNEIILVLESLNKGKETLEQVKEQYNQLSKYEELQTSIEKNEKVKVNNQDVLCTVLINGETKMQIVTAISNEKTVTIQYVSSIDNYDYENAKIILDSLSI